MADVMLDAVPEARPGGWHRSWASIGALLATILLILLLVMVTLANRNRDAALAAERHTQNVVLLTRAMDANLARAEATLGRFVLDEKRETGLLYYNDWRQAGRQIQQLQRLARDVGQRARVDRLRELYRVRGTELAAAATRAAERKDSGGVPYFYQAGLSRTGPALRALLDEIAAAERAKLAERQDRTRFFDARAEQFTEWLGWVAVLIGFGAIILGLISYRALTEQRLAEQEADSEASRAHALDEAVRDRTRELSEANEALLAEAAEREAAEAKLRQVQKMEAVGQLTGGIAHDFNNMLAVVFGGLDLARRKLKSASKREVEFHIDSAMEGATRAAALTRRLLAFSRSEALTPEAVAPAALVDGMLELIDRAIGERIAVQTRFAADPWHVWADPSLLENAILNLCVNARDAMDGQGSLSIVVDNVAVGGREIGVLRPGDYVRISVADSGSGIAPEHLERVFEPFFTTKPVGKGTGLGLSQLFGFARQSDGDVVIDSAVGEGTTVSIYLPRSLREAEAGTIVGTRDDAEVPAPSGAHILVVEDDPRVSRATVASLEELGFRPLACSSGGEALEILGGGEPVDLVITDVMMPEMTGPELVREIEARHQGIAILYVSGFVGEAGESDELAGHDMLRKPFTVSALSDAVAGAMARRFSGSHPGAASEAAE
ncbi:ATP-binding protein [Allosphingosinicella indica]|uniref:histidine kinase n=1 Tax=Allosphingosinicella indica TaxID=941907 RepID=A0A1X7GS65_9SPHN|nr:ATP-binding protein [Allosphingosinicella indica]SMF73946.1 Histidine kinase-, DNA gyrase B-, and HSP90-like ATPase [Allosphingosinicella indica]